MSKISTIYDQLHTVMASSLSGYARLPDPYNIDDNAHLIADKGYAIKAEGGENTNRKVGAKRSLRRSFLIAFVQDITAMAHDASGRSTIDKNMLEDQKTYLDAIADDFSLGGNAATCDYISDGGLQIIVGQNGQQYLTLDTVISLEYFETFGG